MEITREHWLFAVDFKDISEEERFEITTFSLIEEILERAKAEGIIEGYTFEHNFDEDVSYEYKRSYPNKE